MARGKKSGSKPTKATDTAANLGFEAKLWAAADALRMVAAREHRSIVNVVEVLIRDYCGKNGMAIQEQDDLFDDGHKLTKKVG